MGRAEISASALVVRPIGYRDPAVAFAPLANQPFSVLLDGAGQGQSRFAFIAANPFETIKVAAGTQRTDPFASLRAAMAMFSIKADTLAVPSPFVGGAVGFVSYETAHALEVLPERKPTTFPADLAFGLYDVIAVFDLTAKAAWIIASGFPETTPTLQRARAQHRADELEQALGTALLPPSLEAIDTQWVAEMTPAAYAQRVDRLIAYIRAGDVFQANLTQRWTASWPTGVSPFDLYRRLVALSAAPFAAFMTFDEHHQIISASPERFLAVDPQGHVETRPIKGTRPRGATPDEDRVQAAALLTSAKDRAENLMIVDLLRNDISRVCEPGSVAVPTLCGLETFQSVHHLVSVVTGQLRPECTAVDVLQACFPGGSVTGAPKVRAMEIIHELEPVARGPYCGALAWLGFDGAMDSSIIIRTLVHARGQLIAQAGGGIVADSEPTLEYEESVLKAKPLLAALTGHHRFSCASA
jgi:para-aminobenzoate synthetase component I